MRAQATTLNPNALFGDSYIEQFAPSSRARQKQSALPVVTVAFAELSLAAKYNSKNRCEQSPLSHFVLVGDAIRPRGPT